MTTQLKVSIGQHSDKGRKESNQDFHGFRVPNDSLLSLKGIAIALADGISSSDLSHIASESAVKSFLEDYYCTSDAWSSRSSARRVLNASNSWLYTQTLRSPHRFDKDKGYVCTFSGMVIKNHTAHIFHIGDSRVYRLNNKGVDLLTKDHRVWLTQEESYLKRALGMESECKIDHHEHEAKVDDIYILCTDGIYEFVDNNVMANTIRHHHEDLDYAAKTISELAYKNGSHDNLTIQIIRIDAIPNEDSIPVKPHLTQLPIPPILGSRKEFDGYTVLRTLATTNRSHVYLVQDNESNKNVVLKAPSTEFAQTTKARENFLMEEWVARRINSAHVLKADLGERKRNYLYTVFEYIEGQTLAQWATDNPTPSIESVRNIIDQIAKGLLAFHRMEMLHQDIRPENIIIDQQGTIKLIDLGSVSVAGIQETLIHRPLTYMQGTALYSAPEYFLGHAGSTRSEQFSLAVIAYFLLTGKYPYGTKVATTKTLNEQRRLGYKCSLNHNQSIPAWVDHALAKALHPIPERRYGDIRQFIQDLRKPNNTFLKKTKPPLADRNPVLLWQGISFILAVIVVYLLASSTLSR